MARPAEKARAMLNKWVAMRDGTGSGGAPKHHHRGAGGDREPRRRPHLASSVEHLRDAERYRRQVVKSMRDKIAAIQNIALPENKVRELNDDINKLQREKYHWNKRVHQLGGLDHNALERKRQLEEGDTQLHLSYRYYGVAKELPGVKEHIEKELQARKKVKKVDLHKRIGPDYYGWRDEDDGILLEVERKADENNTTRLPSSVTDFPDPGDFLNVPTQEEIAEILLCEKKKAILAKYSL
jgi:pre-mRNA-splicing factor ISY1